MADNEVNITIDGHQIQTVAGKTVLEAATDAGIYIPYLCYHPGMKPFAACRMCVVEVENGRGLPASCTLPVAEGMRIENTSEKVQNLRRNIMELLLADHPHGCLTCHRVDLCGPSDVCLRHVSVNDRCVTCPKNERCELKDTVRFLGMEIESPLEYKYRDLQVDTGDPFYDRDYNLCIVCGRCVRVCEEVRGDNAITFTERSGQALVGTSLGTSLLESGCEFCGACLDVCPVGALVESEHKWEKPQRVERSICPHCPVGCQLNLEVNQFGKLIRSIPEINAPANRGQACFKGKFGMEFVNRKDRLKRPLVRRDGQLVETSWKDALDLVARRLSTYKGDSFTLLTSPNSTNEEQYLAQKFARVVMQTNNVNQTSNTRPNLVKSLIGTVGYAAATNSIWELEEAQCILVFNANLTEEHNVLGVPIKRAIKNGTRLIVIDPREVELTRHADLWLRPKPGTELILLAAILKEILDQGLERREWLEDNVLGVQRLRQTLASFDILSASQESGVPRELVDRAVRMYAPAEPSSILYALDNISQELQDDVVQALLSLSLLTGNLGRESAGIFPLRRGANEQGAWDVGCVPDFLPGYKMVSDSNSRQSFSDRWNVEVPSDPGLDIHTTFKKAKLGQIKAMFVVGDSPNFSNGELGDASAVFESLEFLVVQDSFLGTSSQYADVVFPRLVFAEKSGTYTNLERRVQLLKPVLQPRNNSSRSESTVFADLAKAMDVTGFEFDSSADVMDEIAGFVPFYGGISHKRLETEGQLVFRPDMSNPMPTQILYSDRVLSGLQWPCPDSNNKGTPILYADGFPNGKAQINLPNFRSMDPKDLKEDSFIFTPGRVLLQANREANLVPGTPNLIERDELVEVNREDAAMLNIAEGDLVAIQWVGGELIGRAKFQDGIQRGVIASTSLFGKLMVDLDKASEPDPMSKVPELTVASAQLVKLATGNSQKR